MRLRVLLVALAASLFCGMVPAHALEFRQLLIIKKLTDLPAGPECPHGVHSKMTSEHIQQVEQAFRSYVPDWVSRLTEGRVSWAPEVIVSEVPLTRMRNGCAGGWIDPQDVAEDFSRYVKDHAYDGVFFYVDALDSGSGKIVSGYAGTTTTEFQIDTKHAGFSAVYRTYVEQWTPGSSSTEAFLHEWIHQLEGFYGKFFKTPLPSCDGGKGLPLHCNGPYGFPVADPVQGWKPWYKAFLNGELKDPQQGNVGLGERAWSHGVIRGKT